MSGFILVGADGRPDRRSAASGPAWPAEPAEPAEEAGRGEVACPAGPTTSADVTVRLTTAAPEEPLTIRLPSQRSPAAPAEPRPPAPAPDLPVARDGSVPPRPRGSRRARSPFRRAARAVVLLALVPLLAAALGADLPGGGLPHHPDVRFAGGLPEFLLWLVPPVALALLGLLFAALPKESQVSDHTPVPPARNGEATVPITGVPVRGTVQHQGGSAVPRAALTLVDTAGRQTGRAIAGEDGRYTLSSPGPGSYVLIVAASGHQPRAVSLAVQDRPLDLDLMLGGSGRLTGRVHTEEGEPVAGATVTVTNARGDVVAGTTSGSDGEYAVEGLAAGEYTLAASAAGCRPGALAVGVPGPEPTVQDIELSGGAVLRGTVRAEGGLPVAHARVTLVDAAGNLTGSAITGEQGGFTFTGLAPGEYTLAAVGFPPVASVLQISGGGRTDQDIRLAHPAPSS